MFNRFFKKNEPFTICIIIAAILIILILLAFHYVGELTDNNDKKVTDYIEGELRFDDLEAESKQLEEFSTLKNLSPVVRGRVYNNLSLFYSAEEDPVLYYGTIGKAIYYLELGEDYDTLAGIYADLSYSYYTHGDNELAQTYLDKIYDMIDVKYLTNAQQRSYIYRLQGIIDIETDNYESAETHLLKSIDCVNKDPNASFYGPSYISFAKINLADLYFQNGQYEKCREIINQFDGSELFTTVSFSEITARDFLLPYYKSAINLSIYDNESEEETRALIDKFVDVCETFGFYNYEFKQLVYMQEHIDSKSALYDEKLTNELIECYKETKSNLDHSQSLLINSQISFASDSTQDTDKRSSSTRKVIISVSLVTLTVVILLLLVLSFVSQSNTDALTKVHNRRALDRRIYALSRCKRDYTAIMVDIDNFKQINDTYGHSNGDEVLKILAHFLNDEKRNGFTPYRYGGEEFALIISELNVEKALEAAERLRFRMSAYSFKEIDRQITISAGIGSSQNNNEEVIKQADDNLYHSKNNGKNVVSYINNMGQTVLYL